MHKNKFKIQQINKRTNGNGMERWHKIIPSVSKSVFSKKEGTSKLHSYRVRVVCKLMDSSNTLLRGEPFCGWKTRTIVFM